MSTPLTDALPDPDSNVQLGEGAVPPSELLGGEVKTQFTYRPDHTSLEMALAAVKADQEMMCGYKLRALVLTPTEQADDQGRFLEVFVTFAPEGS